APPTYTSPLPPPPTIDPAPTPPPGGWLKYWADTHHTIFGKKVSTTEQYSQDDQNTNSAIMSTAHGYNASSNGTTVATAHFINGTTAYVGGYFPSHLAFNSGGDVLLPLNIGNVWIHRNADGVSGYVKFSTYTFTYTYNPTYNTGTMTDQWGDVVNIPSRFLPTTNAPQVADDLDITPVLDIDGAAHYAPGIQVASALCKANAIALGAALGVGVFAVGAITGGAAYIAAGGLLYYYGSWSFAGQMNIWWNQC
ncbi:MAG: hypothetical protein GIW99_00275, partial [Candidatus Eremiobacteraeota bacterium]|nr:hypothetical protein [Candidatus Eremiobacteraeota bacterium]